ncbi:hypothetical protein [Serinicoccus sp. CUA-874]|uniref:hypothetical protein n=1 Tax=Serinicoccus sp. CUA-874 TaxID=1517939 RepID=UPI001650ED26|nr:hypothetical protein [Serinicoccus sp. CUA-874]
MVDVLEVCRVGLGGLARLDAGAVGGQELDHVGPAVGDVALGRFVTGGAAAAGRDLVVAHA